MLLVSRTLNQNWKASSICRFVSAYINSQNALDIVFDAKVGDCLI